MKAELLEGLAEQVSDVITPSPNGSDDISAQAKRGKPKVVVSIPRSGEPLPIVVLPSGSVTISQCAAELFEIIGPTRTMFIRGGVVTTLEYDSSGQPVLKPLGAAAARSRFEKHARLFVWRSG